MKKRLLSFVLAVIMLIGVLPAAGVTIVSAEGADTFGAAEKISVNTSYSDNISSESDLDYYKFTLTSAGIVNLTFEHKDLADPLEYWTAVLYDDKCSEICAYSFEGTNTSVKSYSIGLSAGSYYIVFRGGSFSYSYSHRYTTDTYTFIVNYTATEYCETENNESFSDATTMITDKPYQASINDEYDQDFFKFQLSSSGLISLTFAHKDLADSQEYWTAVLYDDSCSEICAYSFEGTNTSVTSYRIGLPAGSYYIVFRGGSFSYSYAHRFETATYSFTVNYTATEYCETENNETFAAATAMVTNQPYQASINDANDQDFYKFTLASTGTVDLSFEQKDLADAQEYWSAVLYDDSCNEICAYSFQGTGTSVKTYNIGLPAGTYYINVTGGDFYYSYAHRYTTDTYTFTVNYTATEYCENENNETFSEATAMVTNQSYQASINDAYDQDYYKFTLTSSGIIDLTFNHKNLADSQEYWMAVLYDDSHSEICAYSFQGTDASAKTYSIGLPAGTYYINVTGGDFYYSYAHRYTTDTYTFMVNYTATEYCENENNETFADATPIIMGQQYQASINDAYDQDCFGFTLEKDTSISIQLVRDIVDSSEECWKIYVYSNNDTSEELYSFSGYGNEGTTTYTVLLPAGTYYINVTGGDFYYSYAHRFTDASYSISISEHTHNYTATVTAPTCFDEGYTTHECSCGDVYIDSYSAALGHAWNDGVIMVEPTETKTGLKLYTCTRCNETKNETLPATGKCNGGTSCPSNKFRDVAGPNDWTHAGIDYAVRNGLFGGTGKNTFEPQTAMTRAMLVTVLWRYEGTPKVGKNTFSDVPNGQWYTDAVEIYTLSLHDALPICR